MPVGYEDSECLLTGPALLGGFIGRVIACCAVEFDIVILVEIPSKGLQPLSKARSGVAHEGQIVEAV